jgi:hypothetical protein
VSKYSATATFSASPDAVLAAAVHVFHNDWGKVPQRGPREVSTSTLLTEFGQSGTERVTLLVTGAGPQGTTVTVRSKSLLFFFLAGKKNQRNVAHVIRRVGEQLATMQAPS